MVGAELNEVLWISDRNSESEAVVKTKEYASAGMGVGWAVGAKSRIKAGGYQD